MVTRSPTKWRSEARSRTGLDRALVVLGARIRSLRVSREMTLESLAEAAALTPNHLQAIESGRSNATVASLYGIALGLNGALGGAGRLDRTADGSTMQA